ncbi:hypothetical protein SRABI96_04885 [Peribacillus sp. Bi96]|nr:hypothetical protein SRABI96_04885 [Peribacillus sp. Bi96]
MLSFFKKLLGQEYVSPEEKEKALIIKEEKRQQREVEYQIAQQQKKKKQAADMQLIEKYFGKSAVFFNRVGFSLYKSTIIHFEKYIKSPDEEVLIAIPAEYDKTKKREIKGMLIATSHRLIFVTNGIGHGEFTEAFDYRKMNGISLAPDGFAQKELLIDYGRTRKIFDDIANDDQLKQFLKVVRSKMNESKRVTGISKAKNKAAAHSDDKYEKLAQIAKLSDQGVLTEEEFEIEKQKILNS